MIRGSTTPVLVVTAPSGVGKTSLISRLIDEDPSVAVAISHTTRQPRGDEENGEQYHFVTDATFRCLQSEDYFIETANVFGFSYGVSWDALTQAQRGSELAILEIDWQGARSVKERGLPVHSVFILPPSRDAQISRLRKRDQDAEEVMQRRIRQTYLDCTHYKDFDFQIVNENFDEALSHLQNICLAVRNNETIRLPDVTPIAEELLHDLKRSVEP